MRVSASWKVAVMIIAIFPYPEEIFFSQFYKSGEMK